MRLFVAIDLPERTKALVQGLIDRLRPTAKLSWSAAANLHVTTKFIGEWPEERLAELVRVLHSVPTGGPLEVAVRGLGWFPNARNPRVFWVGVDGADSLNRLAAATDRALATIGVPEEKREYHPHLTLARRRSPVPLDHLRLALSEAPIGEVGYFQATSFSLYVSAGGKYTKLQEFPL